MGEPIITEAILEPRQKRWLRFLHAESFDVRKTFQRLQDHAAWWSEYGMDAFREEDELDEGSILFSCGEDKVGRPVLVARPCAHNIVNKEESVRMARLCIYTVQRCIERLPPELENIVVIFDAKGFSLKHMDTLFAKEMCSVLLSQFPRRLGVVLVINNSWSSEGFWCLVSKMIACETRERVKFLGSDFRNCLAAVVGEDHPYLIYALEVKKKPNHAVLLPTRSPCVARGGESQDSFPGTFEAGKWTEQYRSISDASTTSGLTVWNSDTDVEEVITHL